MSLKTWFTGLFAPADAAPAPLREAVGQTIDPDEDQWRKLSTDAQRDLTPLTQQRMQKIAHYLWEQNVLANRLIELPVAFLLAEGVQLKVEDEENQKLLDRFWRDPINDMDMKLPKKARELALFGEQCYPAFVNERNGAVRIGYLDPSLIETVVMDPDNPEQPIGVVTVKDKKGRARRYRVIVNGDEEVFTQRTQAIRESFVDGDAFYFRVNDLSAGTRGRSDLLAQADWLDSYDQFLFGEAERANLLRAFIWDVTLKNANEAAVAKRAREITAPRPGSVRVHNDAEEWKAESPELNAGDTAENARLFRNHILGGATMPEHWFGGGGDVNRAAAAEMEGPTLKIYTMRQRVLKHMLESIGRYVLLAQRRVAGGGEINWGDPAWDVQAVFPELSEKDTTKQAAALAQVAAACASLVTQKLLSRKTAVALIATVAGKLGIEVDPDEELAAAETEGKAEADARGAADSFTAPPGLEEDAAVQEARDLIAAFAAKVEDRLTEAQGGSAAETAALAQALADQSRGTQALLEFLTQGTESSRQTQALVEALAQRVVEPQKVEVVLRHPKTKKTVRTPDGRLFELTSEDE